MGKKREREGVISFPNHQKLGEKNTRPVYSKCGWRRRETQNRVSIQFSKPPKTRSKIRDYKFESRLNCSVLSNLGFIGDWSSVQCTILYLPFVPNFLSIDPCLLRFYSPTVTDIHRLQRYIYSQIFKSSKVFHMNLFLEFTLKLWQEHKNSLHELPSFGHNGWPSLQLWICIKSYNLHLIEAKKYTANQNGKNTANFISKICWRLWCNHVMYFLFLSSKTQQSIQLPRSLSQKSQPKIRVGLNEQGRLSTWPSKWTLT